MREDRNRDKSTAVDQLSFKWTRSGFFSLDPLSGARRSGLATSPWLECSRRTIRAAQYTVGQMFHFFFISLLLVSHK